MLVTARREDHETRSENREHQVGGVENAVLQNSPGFPAALLHIN